MTVHVHFDKKSTVIIVNSGEVFEQGGAVHRWASFVSKEMKSAAVAFAGPVNSKARRVRPRTGELEGSIQSLVYADPGNIVHFDVWADAPHAKYVHNGTAYQGRRYIYTTLGYANKGIVDGWIKADQFHMGKGEKGFVMPLPVNSSIADQHLFMKVRGQLPNPFLINAYAITRRKHPGLPKQRFEDVIA